MNTKCGSVLPVGCDVQYSIHSFIHSFGKCRMRRFLTILRSFFHFSLLYTFSCHPSPPTILPSTLTPSCHLFLGLPLSLVSKFIYNILLGILFSSILCTCPNQRNLFKIVKIQKQFIVVIYNILMGNAILIVKCLDSQFAVAVFWCSILML